MSKNCNLRSTWLKRGFTSWPKDLLAVVVKGLLTACSNRWFLGLRCLMRLLKYRVLNRQNVSTFNVIHIRLLINPCVLVLHRRKIMHGWRNLWGFLARPFLSISKVLQKLVKRGSKRYQSFDIQDCTCFWFQMLNSVLSCQETCTFRTDTWTKTTRRPWVCKISTYVKHSRLLTKCARNGFLY